MWKYTALGESFVANIALSFASCYICYSTLTLSCIFHKNWWHCLTNKNRTLISSALYTFVTCETLIAHVNSRWYTIERMHGSYFSEFVKVRSIVMHLSMLCSTSPMRENEGLKQGIILKLCPQGREFHLLIQNYFSAYLIVLSLSKVRSWTYNSSFDAVKF